MVLQNNSHRAFVLVLDHADFDADAGDKPALTPKVGTTP